MWSRPTPPKTAQRDEKSLGGGQFASWLGGATNGTEVNRAATPVLEAAGGTLLNLVDLIPGL